MGKDGDCSVGAKVYESKKEKKRRLAMITGAESEEFVITPVVEIVEAGNGVSSGRLDRVPEKGGGGEMRVTRSEGLRRKLSGEESKGNAVDVKSDSKGRGIGVDLSDDEGADSVENRTDGTGAGSKKLVSLEPRCKITGTAKRKVSELSKSDKKRSMEEDDADEISRKKTRTDHIDIVDHQPENSGEDKSLNIAKNMDKGMDSAMEHVEVSKTPLSCDKDGDGERSGDGKLQPRLRTGGKSKAVRLAGRSGTRNPRNVKDAGFSDIGIKDEDDGGGSSQGRYSRMQGKGGILRVLQSKKKVAVPGDAIGGKRKGIMRRLRSPTTNKVGMKSHLLESQVDEKSISNIKRGRIAGKVSSEDTAKSSINQVTISSMEGSKNVNLLLGMSASAANNTENTKKTGTSRSELKNKIRDHIKNIILEAGWKIEFRPRRGRNYEDAIYVSPKGSGYWSITKAYDIYLKTSKSACDDKEGSGKESNASAEKNSNFKEAVSTLAVIPPEVLHLLKRNVVNKRRGKKEMEEAKRKGTVGRKKKKAQDGMKVKGSKDKGNRADIRGTSAMKRKLMVKNSKRGGCALLVRGSNKDEGSEGDYTPYLWKRTVLSWMIDLGLLPAYEKVRYMNKRRTRALMDGRITRDGIECSCCSKIFTVSKFEVHAGSKLHQPYENICMEVSGISLLQCQINAWEKQEAVQRNFYDVDTEGDDPNDDTCGICADGGDLICCDSCPSTFHLGCLGIEMLPTGDWHCTNCYCKFCGSVHVSTSQDGSASNALFTCLQCSQKYHKGCVPEEDVVPNVSNSSNNMFCRRSCRKVFRKLQKLIGVRHELETGFYWSIVRRFDDPSKSLSSMSRKVESNSKIAVAYAVMDECFVPIVDQRSGINLIHNVVYNCGANFNRLNFSGFYTFILERGDEIIAAASVRIHDIRLAEMPFIGTRSMYRRQGMCRRLLKGIESALRSLCIRRLIIPAISELTETWTTVFGFMPLDISLQEEVKSVNMLVFPGTGLLQKSLLKGSNKHHANPEPENKPETQISVKAETSCQSEEIIDSSESKCDADTIQPIIPVLEHSTNVLQEVSGCHGQFYRSLDSAANLESHDLQNVSSCSNHTEKDVSSSNISNEMAAYIEEPKKEIKDVINILPNFEHPPSVPLHGASRIEASGSRPLKDVSTFESSVSDVHEDFSFGKEDDSTPGFLQKITVKPLSNGVTHDSLEKCELMQVDEDISHEINVVKFKHDNDESNVKEATIEMFGYVRRHLITSPGRSSYASSECCRNGCAANPKLSCVASNESITQEKSELLQNQLKCYFEANDSAPLDQLLVSDSAKILDVDSVSGIVKTFTAYESRLKELDPGVNQHFTSNSEIADDCHDDICDVSILEKQLGVVDLVLTYSSSIQDCDVVSRR
ncbi:hypothetical protein KSP39_PZI021152 [Platanthera zijinensis]|uniref:PHD-type domain-containing protein n=1 Tax=Platanthera zijinensis TaxID=2320716 RepID=A0AAP0AXW0_9ASPA